MKALKAHQIRINASSTYCSLVVLSSGSPKGNTEFSADSLQSIPGITLLLSCDIWQGNCVSRWREIKKRPSIPFWLFKYILAPWVCLTHSSAKMMCGSAAILLFCSSISEQKNWAQKFWASDVCGYLWEKRIDIIEGRNWEVWAKFWRMKLCCQTEVEMVDVAGICVISNKIQRCTEVWFELAFISPTWSG